MLIYGNSKFVRSPFASDVELKKMVLENTDYFFGPNSFCLPQELFLNKEGFEAFTDGFAVDITNRQWYIVNVSLSQHNIWSEVVPQVVKQLVVACQSTTKQLIIELIIQQLREDSRIMKKFNDAGCGKEDEGVFLDEIRSVLEEIFNKPPVIGMPIDSISNDLKNWTETLKVRVRLCVVKQYVDSENPENIIYEIPEENNSEFDTASSGEYSKNTEKPKITKDNLNAREICHTDKGKKVLV